MLLFLDDALIPRYMEDKTMKTSIIIPYHRGEAFLRDCMDSLKEQTGCEMEILLICDHVDQRELECLSDYEEFSIQVYHLQNSSGVAAARNLGLDKATGDYIYFLDSDDYLYGNTIQTLVDAAQERDDDIVYGKKKSTWFSRNVFLLRKEEQDTGDEEEENEARDTDSPELRAENDVEHDKPDVTRHEESEDVESAEDESADLDAHDDPRNGFVKNRYNERGTNTDYSSRDQLLSSMEMTNQAYRILVAKRKGVRNISVLGILFKRSFIEESKIRFPENLLYMSDVPFLLEALSKTDRFYKCLAAMYIKRKHNDAINFPSLSQIKDPNRFYEFLDTYYDTTKRIPSDSELRNLFDRKYITYYTKVFAPKLKRSDNPAWREEKFISMSDIISQMNPVVIRELKGYKKLIIKALIRKDVVASQRIATLYLAYRKLKRILHNKKALYMSFYVHVFLKKPLLADTILFESYFGKSYSGNPKYIYEYLAKNFDNKYKYIWVIDKKHTKIPFQHKKIKRYSLWYYYYLARSKYIVFNGRQPEWAVKRKGSIFLQTWHGTPLKKLVFDIDDITSASPKYKQQVYKQSRAWDYLIAPNAFCSETFRRCFMYENKLLETGYPRNDIMHAKDRDVLAAKIRKQLGIPQDKKTILYAPTWRDDEFYGKGQYKFELQLDLKRMRECLGDGYAVLLRTHYFIADSLDVSSFGGFAYNVSKYDDISELYLISDILITDYSSVFFDYANLRRPMLFFTYDLEKYRDILRGFYLDIEKEVPGPLLYTTEEVIDAIQGIEEVSCEYQQRYDEFYHRFCEWEDGHAAEKVVKSVFVNDLK
jgi:CDP-glycerol glycerophosphotransferase